MGKKLLFFILYFGVVPLGLSFIALPLMGNFGTLMEILLSVLVLGGAITGVIAGRNLQKSIKFNENMLLCLLPLEYTGVLWAVFMLINGGFYGAESWLFYCILHIAYAPIYFVAMFGGEGRLFLWAPLVYELSFVIAMFITAAARKGQLAVNFNKKKQFLSILSVFLLAMGTGAAVQWHRSQTVLPSYGFKYAGGYSSTDLTPYEVMNPNNKLPKLNTKSTFIISNPLEMPVLDGAEGAFPVYSAFALATYENIEKVMGESREVVSFTNTIYSYERLLSGEVDIYLGAEPSKEQREMAKQAGKELVMTPIGKEGFVFFVNPKNEVDSLKVSEIKGIYSGKIKNWSELGGGSEKIIAFQRPKNSGSQTLLEKIMGDTKIMKPLKEDVPEGMGGIIEQVADYRNYQNAIGFSFRFFATGMKENPDIKLLAINEIEPNAENIATGKYPFTATLYAITIKDNPNPNIQPFLDWMQGPQGQELVERIGYIKLAEQ